MPQSANRCRLLELPAELQLYIYELAVVEAEPINFIMDGSTYDERLRELRSQTHPALAQTCRAIRPEALSIFYQRNVFNTSCYHYRTGDGICNWLRVIGQDRRKQLKALFVWGPGRSPPWYDRDCRDTWDDSYHGKKVKQERMDKVQHEVSELRGTLQRTGTQHADCVQICFNAGGAAARGEAPQ